MPKKQQNKTSKRQNVNTKAKKLARAMTVARSARQSVGRQTLELAKSIIDPWKYSGCIPDGSNGVACFTIRQVFDVSTGAGGGAGSLCIQADPRNAYNLDSNSVSNTFTIAGTNFYQPLSAIATISNSFSRWRPISMGARATYVGSTMNDQGLLVVAQLPGNTTPSQFSTGTTSTVYNTCTYSEVYPLKNGGQITWRPEDPEDFQFLTIAGSSQQVNAVTASQTPWLFVGFTGAQAVAATQAIRVEVVWNFEGLLSNPTFNPGGNALLTTKSAEPGWMEKAANIYRRVLPYMPGSSSIVQGIAGAATATGMAAKVLALGAAGIPNFQSGTKLLLGGGKASSLYDLD